MLSRATFLPHEPGVVAHAAIIIARDTPVIRFMLVLAVPDNKS